MNAHDPIDIDAFLSQRDGVRRLVRCLVSDEHAVDDVVQDTCLAAIEKPPRPGRDLRTWLSGVARNVARRRNRSEARRRAREQEAARPEATPPAAGIVERAAAHRRVVSAVLELGEPYRTMILLRFFEGRSPRQIARENAIRLNTVNSRIQRGLTALRCKLSREFGVERSALATVLLPLVPAGKGLLTGALIMGAKLKIALAAALVLGAAVLVYHQSGKDIQPAESPAAPPAPAEASAAAAETKPAAEPPAPVAPERTAAVTKPADTPSTAAPPPTAAMAEERMAISGTVRSVTGAPISGASVCATSSDSPLVRLRLTEPLTTTTDARGQFVFAELDKRLRGLIVEVSAPGYGTDRRGILLGENCDFVLGAPGSVRGRVTSRKNGSPCAGATISLTCLPLPPTRLPTKGTTDEAGFYRIDDLKAGTYRVSVFSPEHLPELSAGNVVVRSGGETIADFELRAGRTARGRILSALTGQSLTGARVLMASPSRDAVTDATGRYELRGIGDRCSVRIRAEGYAPLSTTLDLPAGDDPAALPDVTLQPLAVVGGHVLGTDDKPVPGAEVRGGVQPAHTDASGRFEVEVAKFEASFQLEVLKAGLARTSSEPLALKPGEVRSDVVIRMNRGGRVSGRVVGPTGVPVAKGIRVLLNPAQGLPHRQEAAPATADGSFQFEAVPAGRYDLVVSATEQDLIGQRRPGLTIVEGGELAGLEIVLEKGTTISGRVVDEEGRPVRQARVVIRSRDPGAIPGVRLGRTDLDGRFVVAGLMAGEHSVMAEAEDFQQAAAVITIGGATDVVVRLERKPPPVTGVVLLRESRTPVAPFWVRVHGPFDSRNYRFLDGEGRFEIALRQGIHFIEAGTENGLVSERAVRVEVRRTPPPLLELLLVPGFSITGAVRQPDGAPAPVASVIALAAVSADESEPAVVGRAQTDRDGRFSLKSLRPGTVFLTASARDWIETTREVQLAGATSLNVDLTLEARGARLRVEVEDEDGKPVEGAEVKVKTAQGRILHVDVFKVGQLLEKARADDPDLDAASFRRSEFATDARGVFTRHFLPAGHCRVEVSKFGFEPVRRTVELLADVESSVRVVLEKKR